MNLPQKLINTIKNCNNDQIVSKCLCILIDFTSGTNFDLEYLFNIGIHDDLLSFLSLTTELNQEKIIIILKNIIKRCKKTKRQILQKFHIFNDILIWRNQLNFIKEFSIFFKILITDSYINPLINSQVLNLLKTLFQYHKDDQEILNELLECVYQYMRDLQIRIDGIIDTGILKEIITFLYSQKENLITKSLKIIDVITSETDRHTKYLIDNHLLNALHKLLFTKHKNHVCWIISNINAEGENIIEYIFEEGIFSTLIKIYNEDNNDELEKEIIWCISNVSDKESIKNIKEMMRIGIINILFTSSKSSKVIEVSLQGIVNILEQIKGSSIEDQFLDMYGDNIVQFLEKIKGYENPYICYKSQTILMKYFEDEIKDD